MSPFAKTYLVIGLISIIATVLLLGLGNTLLPLLISVALAYLSFPLIQSLERRGVPRQYAVASVFALMAGALVLTLALVVPNLIEDGRQFLKELPQTSAVAVEKVEALTARFGFDLKISEKGLGALLAEQLSAISGDFLKSTSTFLVGIFSNFLHGLLFILNLFLIPIFYFHLINRYESLSEEAKNLIPVPWRPKVREYAQLANTVLTGYFRGQVLVALILAAFYGIGLTLIGLRFGLFIGICTGLLSIIPYVGSLLGLVTAIAVVLANFTGFGTIIGVAVVFVIAQVLEGFVLTPRFVGNKVGLSDLASMLALIIGGNLFGFVGMMAAIPAAAILKRILMDLKQQYTNLSLYKG